MLLCTAAGDVFSWGWGDKGQLGHGNHDNINRPKLVRDSFNKQLVSQAVSVSVSLSIPQCRAVSLSPSLALSVCLCLSVSICVSHRLFVFHSVCLCFSVSVCVSQRLSLSACASQCLSLFLTIWLHSQVTGVSCGLAHSAAVAADGSIYMWGWDEYGQCGLGSFAFGKTKAKPVCLFLFCLCLCPLFSGT